MSLIWRPAALSESTGGKPLAVFVSDVFTNFDYDRVQSDPWWLALFLRPLGVMILLVFYLNSKPLFEWLYLKFQPKDKTWFVGAVALHNLALALFSAAVAYNTWPIVFLHFQQYGAWETYCDPHGTLWNESGFGTWTVIFYLSKYYEFVDSWVLVLKGKKPSFLQVYHHTGICFCMWVGTISHSSYLIFVVLLNSVIHTLMYTYFLIKTINPKAEIKAAKYLTTAQIGQFFTGIGCSFPMLFLGDSCTSSSTRFALMCLQIYGVGLIALFMMFAKKKYSKKE